MRQSPLKMASITTEKNILASTRNEEARQDEIELGEERRLKQAT